VVERVCGQPRPSRTQGVPPSCQVDSMKVYDSNLNRAVYRKLRRRFDNERTPRELTFSCFKGYKFLNSDRTRNWFVEAVREERQHWPIDLWAWVLMPEHVHLLVAPRSSEIAVGNFAGRIKERVARQAIKWLEQNAPQWIPKITVHEGKRARRRFWQPGGGYDRNVDEIETLERVICYFHMNPVRRGLVKRPEDWEWSSARWYHGIRPVHLEMDQTLPVLVES
jgi:putative transposase